MQKPLDLNLEIQLGVGPPDVDDIGAGERILARQGGEGFPDGRHLGCCTSCVLVEQEHKKRTQVRDSNN